ncbi:AraC family transcriptional regulator ligand-binding domain-containing protein [Algoriphagus formosus]|uniref:AraC family transcriptional regulator ligand-binding domain-containing protein n=1 Tax=Algoriphagus formosus TaxID=2007308 RepID=UPI0012FE059C|nr:AraC family transcriptional regulator ligand-binding domain-containing protein [Algoriphagus formosus]
MLIYQVDIAKMKLKNRSIVPKCNCGRFGEIRDFLEYVKGQKILPNGVTFQHIPSSSSGTMEEFFQSPVEFGAMNNMLQFRTESLHIRTIKADKSIHRFIVERL